MPQPITPKSIAARNARREIATALAPCLRDPNSRVRAVVRWTAVLARQDGIFGYASMIFHSLRSVLFVVCSAFCANAASSKTLVFCSEGNPESINPQIASTKTGMNAGRPIFNNLVEFAPGSADLIPSLAESFTISRDGTQYTFHLREGVTFHASDSFHPSRNMNADDVIFSLE